MIREHDTVVLSHDIKNQDLKAGDVGAVVHTYESGKAFEVEFITAVGETIALLTLRDKDIRPMGNSEILHVRDFATI